MSRVLGAFVVLLGMAPAAALTVFASPAEWSADPAVNLKIAIASGQQSAPALATDRFGNATVLWSDRRAGHTDVLAQRVGIAGQIQWTANGVTVGSVNFDRFVPRLVLDGAGGAAVAWFDARSGLDRVYAQRLSSAGAPLWAPGGVGVAIAPVDSAQIDPAMIADGAGGTILAWCDRRNPDPDIYAQRLDASGVPLWGAAGAVVCDASGAQEQPVVVPDGAGGAIVVWADARGGYYAQHLDDAGARQWMPGGVVLCAVPSRLGIAAVADGSGGVIAVWTVPAALFDTDLYAQRLDSAGIPQWGSGGVAVCVQPWWQRDPVLVSDGAGGAIAAWDDRRTFHFHDVYAQRVSAGGVTQWTANGVLVTPASLDQVTPAMDADGAGGAVIAWADSRSGVDLDLYAQRLDASGAALWAPEGVAVSTAPDSQVTPEVASDRAGGAVIAWADRRNGADYDIYAQRVLASGALAGTVDAPGAIAPDRTRLGPPTPNPTRGETLIPFTLAREASVRISVFDQQGRCVRTLMETSLPAGEHAARWDGRDGGGSSVRSGVYFCRLMADGHAWTRRMVAIR